ncbi:MAG: STAS/SEC14 domain-containing protein [Pyrinomonadaceae bacterium]|nr:STAS/SEC14 domain-containing protein [Pyrinomonadaceae bacterium]
MIAFLHEELPNLVAFRLSGTVSAEDIDQVADRLEKSFDSEEFVNLYVEIDNDLQESFGGISEQAKKGFSVILPNLGKLRKAAVVSDKSWIQKITDFKDMFFSMDMKAFPESESDGAFEWITAKK